MLAKSWGGEQCWVLVLVVGGRERTVTFRASRADRKDKNGGEKRRKEKLGGLAIVPRKRSPDQACDLPSSSWWLTFGVMGDAGIHLSILSYELQLGTKVCLADRASSNHDHLKHRDKRRKAQEEASFFSFFSPKNDNPSIHMPYAKHCILFPISSRDCSNQTRGEAGKGEVMMVFRARKEEKCMKTELCRTPLSGVLKQTAVVLRFTHSPVHKHTHTNQQRLTYVLLHIIS